MKEWYENLSRRDQLLLWPLVGVLLLALLYGMVWSPVADATRRLAATNDTSFETLSWMREAVATISQSSGVSSGAGAGQSMSTLIDRTLPQHSLVMKRFQPFGDNGAQVSLEDAALTNVVAWLSALEVGSGMRLLNVSIVSSDKPGFVKTRLRLERG